MGDIVHWVRLPDIELAYLERGQGPLVLCLHGFPDTAHSFEPLLTRLAQAGFHAVAPFLRGYRPSGLASNGDYRITTVAGDVIGLLDAFGASRAYLVGHDWGAAASYLAAARHPERIAALVTAAVPHLRRFLWWPSWRQLRRSRYMGFFQLPWIPERRIAAADFAWLRRLVREWSPHWRFSSADLAPVEASLADPARRAAALAYYRTLPRVLLDPRTWPLLAQPLRVPAKVIFGADDGCIGPEMFERQAHCFGAGYEPVRFDHAGHFMHCEQPTRFADEVLAFLARHPL